MEAMRLRAFSPESTEVPVPDCVISWNRGGVGEEWGGVGVGVEPVILCNFISVGVGVCI